MFSESPEALQSNETRIRWPNVLFQDDEPRTTTDEEPPAENQFKVQRKQSVSSFRLIFLFTYMC